MHYKKLSLLPEFKSVVGTLDPSKSLSYLLWRGGRGGWTRVIIRLTSHVLVFAVINIGEFASRS